MTTSLQSGMRPYQPEGRATCPLATGGSRWRWLLTTVWAVLLSAGWAQAQNRADAYAFSQSNGTYSAIVGTTVSTTNSDDDSVYPATTIPFSFTYAGTAYTTLRITSNGYITFGATAPSSSLYTPISSATAYAGVIAAFATDGGGRSNTGARISTDVVGTAPNREFVIQWANWNAFGSINGIHNYQIRLSETSNVINIVYGSFTGLGASPSSAPRWGFAGQRTPIITTAAVA